MATSAEIRDDSEREQILVWLDDTAGDETELKTIFLTLFAQVRPFKTAEKCLSFVRAVESPLPCLSILVSGKYGQMLVEEHFQPANQVKDIYVFCFDMNRHNQWAQNCSKVRCVNSEIQKILEQMQRDLLMDKPPQNPRSDHEPHAGEQGRGEGAQELIEQEPERYSSDTALYDQLALRLLLNGENTDGAEDFVTYCRAHNDNQVEQPESRFKPQRPITDWYQPDLEFLRLHCNDFEKLWTLRWFIRLFHEQIVKEFEGATVRDGNFTVYSGRWLTAADFDGMKVRIGQTMVMTELLLAHTNEREASTTFETKSNESMAHRVLFQINVNRTLAGTVPYADIGHDEVLFWFGARYRLMKIEYIDEQDPQGEPFWLIGLNLCSTLDSAPSVQNLFAYYQKNLMELNDNYHALGRILMYKGDYHQSEEWLRQTEHHEDLAELALRQCHYERATQLLERLPEDSDNSNLLRAYACILASNPNIAKGRVILTRLSTEATDRILRARVSIALGFINLTISQNSVEALEKFTVASEVLAKYLPDIHPHLIKALIGIAYTHFAHNDINEARKYFEMALTRQKQALTSRHPDFARTHSGLAHCHSAQERTMKQAMREFEHALDVLFVTFHRDEKYHAEILATIHDMKTLEKGRKLQARNTLLDYV